MTLVAGVDSSTQSCKVVVRDAATGALVRSGRASHPDGTSINPEHWWTALLEAVADAGGLEDVSAIAVGGQQHGMVALDADGVVIRDALLWNDTRSAGAATALIAELDGGASAWAEATGSVPVASYTVTKLRWLADSEPDNAAKVAAVALPHDWLTWRLAGANGLDALVTDRSDASGTGYWSPATGEYRRDILDLALRRDTSSVVLPRVLGPSAEAGRTVAHPGIPAGLVLGPGAGDNAAAALGLGLEVGDVAVSIGTSGVVSAISATPVADPTGLVSGFADATGAFLPLACTLNASRVLDAARTVLSVDHEGLSDLALSAEPGAAGLTLVPYLEGERTPNRPDATGAFHGFTLESATPANVARASVEGLLCGLADGLAAINDLGIPAGKAVLIGGGARSRAVRALAPSVLGLDTEVPVPGEYVADGAARQAAWVLLGGDEAPRWASSDTERTPAPTDSSSGTAIRARYSDVRELTAPRAALA